MFISFGVRTLSGTRSRRAGPGLVPFDAIRAAVHARDPRAGENVERDQCWENIVIEIFI